MAASGGAAEAVRGDGVCGGGWGGVRAGMRTGAVGGAATGRDGGAGGAGGVGRGAAPRGVMGAEMGAGSGIGWLEGTTLEAAWDGAGSLDWISVPDDGLGRGARGAGERVSNSGSSVAAPGRNNRRGGARRRSPEAGRVASRGRICCK
jgi:hypothetical protein